MVLIESIEDSRLEPYRDLKSSAARERETFVAEGEKLVVRLLESGCPTDSVLCTEAALTRLAHLIPQHVPVYVATTPIISKLIGFQFHRGVLACGRRPAERTLEGLCRELPTGKRALLVLCPEIRDPENLGTILRTAAAFGAAGAVVGRAGTDPFSRRVLRTSMGSVLRLPLVQTDDWHAVIDTLQANQFRTVATVLDDDAIPLDRCEPPARSAIFLGNEAEGLPPDLAARCNLRVTLPMAPGTDSLNVAVAAGIVMYQLAQGGAGG